MVPDFADEATLTDRGSTGDSGTEVFSTVSTALPIATHGSNVEGYSILP